MWLAPDLAAAAAAGLREAADERDRAGEPVGLDGLREIDLHPPLAAGFAAAGHGVLREQRYPSDAGHRRRSRGRRCDLVLTAPPPAGKPPVLDDPAAAFWLEVKSVAQHAPGGSGRSYGPGLLSSPAWDVAKIADDPLVVFAGLLVIAFTEDAATARHDLDLLRLCGMQAGLPLLSPAFEGFPLRDRVGNARATVALFPVLAGAPGGRVAPF